MKEGGEDIYFNISAGPHLVTTKYIENAKKDFTMNLKESFYVEYGGSDIKFVAFDKDLVSDDILGSGSIDVEQLSGSREEIIKLSNQEGEFIGEIIVAFKK